MARSKDGKPPTLIARIAKGVNDIEIGDLQVGVVCSEDKDEEPFGPHFGEQQEDVEVPPEGEGFSEDESSEGEDDIPLALLGNRNHATPRLAAPVRAPTEHEDLLAAVGLGK